MKRLVLPFKTILLLLLLLSTFNSLTLAEGLFPSMNQLFGTAMPSIGLCLGRVADEKMENSVNKSEIYKDFSYEDYIDFGSYLGGTGAVLMGTELSGSHILATVSVRDSTMQFVYEWKTQTATAIYPSGTRPETEKEVVDVSVSILPPVGGIMPSAQFAIDRAPDYEETSEDGIMQIWDSFTDDDYFLFSSYMAQTGAKLLESNVDAGILEAEIGLSECCFTFTYNWHTKSACVFYPNGTFPEREKWNVLKGDGSILPEIYTIGQDLPNLSRAISRLPDSTETLNDGSLQEIYNNFYEAEYTTFSSYLQRAGCTVEDYHVENDSVMMIHLRNLTGAFTFTYDSLQHIGKVIYPIGSRVEAAWVEVTATPVPVAITTPIPAEYYSEGDCWDIAERYFKNLRWKNPESLTIYGHTSHYDAGSTSFTFIIDYSVQNGFGGYNRENYYIIVNADTWQVISAFSLD